MRITIFPNEDELLAGSDPISVDPDVVLLPSGDEYGNSMHLDQHVTAVPQGLDFNLPKSDAFHFPQRAPFHHLPASDFSAVFSSDSESLATPFVGSHFSEGQPDGSSDLGIDAGVQDPFDLVPTPIPSDPLTDALSTGNPDDKGQTPLHIPHPVNDDKTVTPAVPDTDSTSAAPSKLTSTLTPTSPPIPISDPSSTSQSKSQLSDLLFDEIPHFRKSVWNVWPDSMTLEDVTKMSEAGLGLTVPNGIPFWGSSTKDFYRVRCVEQSGAEKDCMVPGSVLAMYGAKEHETAAVELEREYEHPRRMENDFWVGEGVKTVEESIRKGEVGVSMKVEKRGRVRAWNKKSLFAPQRYPSPWPLVPFSYETDRLQKRIPFKDLPEKLVVHDPWNLLAVNGSNKFGRAKTMASRQDWTKREDITHTYHLKVLEPTKDSLGKQTENVEMGRDNDQQQPEHGFVVFQPTSASAMASTPLVFVSWKPPPEEPKTKMDEAHLYLSVAHACGSGSHSEVWQAEWEIPRRFVVEEEPKEKHVLCRRCVLEAVVKRLEGVKRRSWRVLKRKTARKATKEKLDQWAIYDAVLQSTNTMRVKHVSDTVQLGEDLECAREWADWAEITTESPIRRLQTHVKWQEASRPSCRHMLSTFTSPISKATPPTAKVRVIAKLSNWGDRHLRNEARNYQAFPDHFFEHWSGVNVLEALENPVPVGPVVPQFYGYYVPDSNSDCEGYLSPILLLEDCGKPVDFRRLTQDETKEAESLFYRFNHAGWTHASIAPRNIVVQVGPLYDRPSERAPILNQSTRSMSFRLIDFGRSWDSQVARRSSPSRYYTSHATERWDISGLAVQWYF